MARFLVGLVSVAAVGAGGLYASTRHAQAKEEEKKARRCQGVILSGAPGSGKGTQCEKIVADLGFVHMSTGDMLRAAVKAGTPLGQQADGFMKAGKLVPDELVIGIVNEKMVDPDVKKKGWILDGFPRTAVQAQALKDAGCQPNKVILLDVPDSILLERITGRRSDPVTNAIYHMKFKPATDPEVAKRLIQRSDDTAEKLQPRLVAYHENVDAILAFYKKEKGVKVVSIDGNRAPDVIYVEVKKELLNADA
jgi:adenylate kinase